MSSVGKSVSHESALGHVTGSALYTDDLCSRFPGLLHAWPVMSPHAHAKVLSIDTSKAWSYPGVVKVLGQSDVLGENNTGAARRDEPLFPEEVEFHGQPVAWVLAESNEAAIQGAAQVAVEYEPLPAIIGIEAAEAANSYLTEAERIERGDVEAAFAKHQTLEGKFFVGGQEHFYLETQCALAYLDEAESVLVQSSTQHPTETQEIVARVLGVEKNRVVVQSLRMGGAFGGKEVQANVFAAVAALGARLTGRPVRARLDRARDMILTGKRHPFLGRYRIGFDNQGKIQAFDLQLTSDGGYSLDLSAPVLGRALFHCDNAYNIPNLRVVGRVAKTHTTSHTAFRGFGGPQGMVMIEDALDAVARKLDLPPHVVRERNFYRDGDTTHYGQPVKDAGRIQRIWDRLLETSAFEQRWEEANAFNASSSTRKRGLAVTPVKFGISFTAKYYNQGGALVLIYRDGSVQVNHGGTEMGQGLHTKMRQVAAHTLGIPLESVRIMPTRTDKVPNTSATAASSGTDLNGAAVADACRTLRERVLEVAGRLLGHDPGDLLITEGAIHARGASAEERRIGFAEAVERAYQDRIQLSSTGFYRTPEIHYDRIKGRGKPFHYFAYGAAVTEVEVDGFTGMYRILRTDILHDVGSSISPLVDRGQVEGGFIQGLGWLTQEELWWAPDGKLGTVNASTYKLPSLGECPDEFHVELLERAEEPGVIYGSKAVGEPPFMLAISAREALRQAVSSFATVEQCRSGVSLASPATAEAVFWAMDAVQRGEGHAASGLGNGVASPALRSAE
ncbi:MAG: xanthine dehydrogenase molybdopterin binding subunit [Polyangiaceae bacterium]|nr:xanthine dehydrogenase molybdopterin binding subunit [Polyangiaceae bacterium]MCB9607415.1 xanthine dehydrogenase molybdopterin binding subunit [Polyangiaceae bacterium]